jgi:periplasmic protein TonB
MDTANRILQFSPPVPGAPLGAARDDATGGDKAPPVVLRVDNVVPFVAERSDGGAARRPISAQDAAWPGGGQAAAMAAAREALPRRPTGRLRWAACLALALAFHAAVIAALLRYWHPAEEQIAGAPLILIELAPLPVAPAVTPSDAPPGPQQMQTAAAPPVEPTVARDVKPEPNRPEPEKPVETTATVPPAPQAEQPVAALPPPKPAEQPREEKHRQSAARQASAPSSAAHRANRAAAPAPGASAHNPAALPNWKSRLVARLERYKRYPAEAQARGEHGVAQLAFSVDRSGGVHRARILRSSGSAALDRATLTLIARAQPLPPPPPEIRGAQIAIVVPIRYNIR